MKSLPFLRPNPLIAGALFLSAPGALFAQTMVTIMEPTTSIPSACVMTIMRTGIPNTMSPTSYINIEKTLDMSRVCTWQSSTGMAGGICNPGMAAGATNTGMLIASAIGTDLSMNPGCVWQCAGCGMITTTAAKDGLPVELMDFSIQDEADR